MEKGQLCSQRQRETGPKARIHLGHFLGTQEPVKGASSSPSPGQIGDKFGTKRVKTELTVQRVSAKAELPAILKREQTNPLL